MSSDRVTVKRIVGEIGEACYALKARRAFNRLSRLYTAYLLPVNLEISQFSTLCIVAGGRARTVQKIADFLGAERSTLARNLKVLVKRGLLLENSEDGRLAYDLTSIGEETLNLAIPLWRGAQKRAEQMRSSVAQLRTATFT